MPNAWDPWCGNLQDRARWHGHGVLRGETEKKPDGSTVSTIKDTKTDGSVTETKEITAGDNSAVLTATVKTDASGNKSGNAIIRTGVSNTQNTINISEDMLRNVAEYDVLNRVVVEITDTTVNSAIMNDNQKTVVNVNIPSVEGVEIEKVVLTKDSIQTAKDTGKGLTINIINASKDNTGNYNVTIPVKQLAKIDASVEEINVTVSADPVTDVVDTAKKNAITKIVDQNNGKKKKTCVISLAENKNVTTMIFIA